MAREQLAFSPFFENKLACASAANFGIVGNGRLWVLGVGAAAPPPRPGMPPPMSGVAVEKTWVNEGAKDWTGEVEVGGSH